jgi:hypothetical protein
VRKWAGALAAVIVLAVLSNWLINSIRRFDTQQRAEQDPAAGAGAPGAAAEPAAGQNSGVPKIPSDRSASRESKPPPAAPATSPAPVGSERNPPKTLEDAALALLPDPALRRQRDAPWRRAASADLLIQMDQIEESIVAAFSALDRTPPADRYERHSQHSAELRGVLEPPSTPMDEAALVGNWLCRTTSVGNHGVLTYTYFECTIRKTAPCLQLRKTGGSSRFEGCLYRLDDRTYVHVGTPKGIDSPTAEGRLGGFLTQMRPGRLRLLEATGPSTFGVLDFKRR